MQEKHLSRGLGEEMVPDLDSIYQEHGREVAYKEVARLWELHFNIHSINSFYMSRHYYRAAAYSKALDALEKGYEIRNPNMPYIGTGTRYEALHDSARFLAILDSMNLPHPKK